MRRVWGVPTARLEEMLVDAAQLLELAAATSDTSLLAALRVLLAHHNLNRPLLQ